MEMEKINHFGHPHPLVLLNDQETGDESKKGDCAGCGKAIDDDGLSYGCGDCSYFLHKKCVDLPREILHHPLHLQHPLVLHEKSPYTSGGFCCNLCGKGRGKGRGFTYHCASCQFDLDVACATHPQLSSPNLKKLQHFSHDHPLVFVENIDSADIRRSCSECMERMRNSFYCCLDCRFYLHKGCAEVSIEMNELGHRGHPVLLLPNILPKLPPRQEVTSSCLFGQRSDEQFIYYCFSCKLDIGVKDTCISRYPLALTEEVEEEKGESSYRCGRCKEHTPDPVYHSITGDKFLHRKCAELPVKISNHPLHPPHPLFLLSYWERSLCLICGKMGKTTYRCSSCQFNACICCATSKNFLDGNFHKIQHFNCDDLLILIEDTDIDQIREFGNCSGCKGNIYAPFYYCPVNFKFVLHKSCAELPLEISHPSHRKHLLTLLASPPPRRKGCSRNYLYEKSYEGYVYYCSICDFGFKSCDAFLQTIKGSHHQHPFAPLPKPISFLCDACGIEDHCGFPYACPPCALMVHKKCASLRKNIKITRHRHRLSHIYSLQEKEDRKRECNICLDEVNTAFGSYCCLACDYFAHVGCALNKFHLEEGSEDEDEDDVSFEINHGDQREHFSHEHSLMFNDCTIEDGKSCDGCMQLISTSHYSCAICEFLLHKSCFELPKKRRHWTSKKPLTLKFYVVFSCSFCNFYGSGFCYEGAKVADGEIEERMCIRCYRIPDIVTTERHKHRLIFDNEYKEKCSGCGAEPYAWSRIGPFKFKCKVCSGFALCYRCLTQPDTVEYKLDVHPLVLCTSPENHDPSQSYCDWCEERKDPTRWFYHCADCDLPLDLNCALGVGPFVKLGKPFRYKGHKEHPVTFVKIKFNAPKCNKCKRRCGGVSLQCTKPDCDYMVHWKWPCVPYPRTPILHED